MMQKSTFRLSYPDPESGCEFGTAYWLHSDTYSCAIPIYHRDRTHTGVIKRSMEVQVTSSPFDSFRFGEIDRLMQLCKLGERETGLRPELLKVDVERSGSMLTNFPCSVKELVNSCLNLNLDGLWVSLPQL